MSTALTDTNATFFLSKHGPAGHPQVEMAVSGSATFDQLSGALRKNVLADADVMKRLGLKACGACLSGVHILIRDRFDGVIAARL